MLNVILMLCCNTSDCFGPDSRLKDLKTSEHTQRLEKTSVNDADSNCRMQFYDFALKNI